MAPACNVRFTFETHSVVWLNCIVLPSYRATTLRYLFAAVFVQIFAILFVVATYSAVKKFLALCLVTGASVNISGIVELFQYTVVSASFLVMSKFATTCRMIITHRIRIIVVGFVIDDTVGSWRPILLYTCILSRTCIEYNHGGSILTNSQQIV